MNGKQIEELKQLLKNPLYYYLSMQLREIDFKLDENKSALKKLSFEQQGLKRGKSELVKLRREVKESLES